MKWSLRTKILSGYGLILLLLGFLLIMSFTNLQTLGKASGAILRENYKSIIAAEYMIDSIERQDSAILLLLLGFREEGGRQFTENIPAFTQWLGRAADNITIQGEAELIRNIQRDYVEYLNIYEQLVEQTNREQLSAREFYHETVLPLFRQVRQSCHELRELNQQTMYESSEEAQKVASRSTASLLITGGSIFVLGLFFSFLLSNLIVRPLNRIMEGIRAIEREDYDTQIVTSSKDELGRLSSDFNNMIKQLKRYRELNIGQIMAEKKKIETIIHTIDAGIVVVDTDARITDINAKASEILGVKEVEVKGDHFLEVIGEEDIFEQVKKAIEQGSRFPSPGEDNSFSIDEEGNTRHFQFFVTPISIRTAEVQGAVLLLRDVTQFKELSQLKSEFIMKASHELKNPLTGLGMSLSLLKEADLSALKESERQLVISAEEDLQRLRTMVSDLLDLSKIEAGKLPIEISEIDVGVVIDKTVSTMNSQGQEKEIAVSGEYPEDLPRVLADANKILWVLTNLVANALRYTASGGYVKISTENYGPYIQINVQDNGDGIPYEKQAHIFEKFFQVKDSPGESGSLGIGLAICKDIVKAHGGVIWVDSTPGEGSTFSFTLPRAAKDEN